MGCGPSKNQVAETISTDKEVVSSIHESEVSLQTPTDPVPVAPSMIKLAPLSGGEKEATTKTFQK
jgi:hypothetical protein